MNRLSTWQQRVLTGTVFAAVMLGGVLGGIYSFIALFAAVMVSMLYEFYRLIFHDQAHEAVRTVAGTIVGSLPFFYLASLILSTRLSLELYSYSFIQQQQFFLLYIAIVFLIFLIELFLGSPYPFSNVGHFLTGIVYIGLPFYCLLDLSIDASSEYNYYIDLGILLLIWSNDTWAYFIGSRWGKRPFFARISPKKTWEGSIGGVVMTLLTGYLLSLYFQEWRLQDWLIVAAIAAITGSLGDLVESMLKRSLGIKDSGNLFPGHGGMLDRFDAFVFAIPFIYLYIKLFFHQL